MPQEILDSSLDMVLAMIEYERFTSEYEESFIEMNKPE